MDVILLVVFTAALRAGGAGAPPPGALEPPLVLESLLPEVDEDAPEDEADPLEDPEEALPAELVVPMEIVEVSPAVIGFSSDTPPIWPESGPFCGAGGAPPAALDPALVPDVEASDDVPDPPEVVEPPDVFEDVVADELVEPVEIADVSFVRGLNASGPLFCIHPMWLVLWCWWSTTSSGSTTTRVR